VKEASTPRIRHVKIRVFYLKKVNKRLIKDVDNKYTKLFKPNDKVLE